MIHERHRHRYEFNNEYKDALVEHGLTIAGINPNVISGRNSEN